MTDFPTVCDLCEWLAEELLGDMERGDFGNEDFRHHPAIPHLVECRRQMIERGMAVTPSIEEVVRRALAAGRAMDL